MALAIWRGSWESAAEGRCLAELRRIADEVFRKLTPQGMLSVQQGVLQLVKECTESGTTGDAVVSVPATPRQERPLEGEPIQSQEMGVPEPRGSRVADGAEDQMAGGAGDGLDDP